MLYSMNVRAVEMEEDFNEGIVFERTPDIITPGHLTNFKSYLSQESMTLIARKEKVLQRAEFSNYPLLPTKFDFVKIVRI